jgi:hypothetical protein
MGTRRDKRFGVEDAVGWMKRFVKIDRVFAKFAAKADVDAILSRIDLERCPATQLFLKAREKRVQASSQMIKDNDVDDWMYLPVVPYADVILSERNLAHYMRQADPSVDEKVTSDPNRAVLMLEKWC